MTTHRIEAASNHLEQLILGCMLNSVNHVKIACQTLKEADFFCSRHRAIFRAIHATQASDLFLAGEQLKHDGAFVTIGGYEYLTELSQCAALNTHIEEYCAELQKFSLRRALIQLQADTVKDLENNVDPAIALDRIISKTNALEANKPHATSMYRHLLEPLTEDTVREEMRNTSPGAIVGLRIGEVDLRLPGGQITTIAGPTGHGKTLVLINFILNYLELNPEKKACFFSYEENRGRILTLLLNTFINESLSKNNRESISNYFRDGNPTYMYQEKQQSFLKKKDEFIERFIHTGRLMIYYSDYPIEELVGAIHFIKSNIDPGLLAIDYAQFLKMNDRKKLARQEELKEICLNLKECALQTGIPILLAAQFNRTVVAERDLSPTAVGEAGDLERISNIMIGIWNRNIEGFSNAGNLSKNGEVISREPAMYMQILKGRSIGQGQSEVFDLNGNTGKLTQRSATSYQTHPQPIATAQDLKKRK